MYKKHNTKNIIKKILRKSKNTGEQHSKCLNL